MHELQNTELLSQFKTLVPSERKVTGEVLQYIAEIDRRRLYLDLGGPAAAINLKTSPSSVPNTTDTAIVCRASRGRCRSSFPGQQSYEKGQQTFHLRSGGTPLLELKVLPFSAYNGHHAHHSEPKTRSKRSRKSLSQQALEFPCAESYTVVPDCLTQRP